MQQKRLNSYPGLPHIPQCPSSAHHKASRETFTAHRKKTQRIHGQTGSLFCIKIHHWVVFSKKSFWSYGSLYDVYFHFCCKLVLDTWAMGLSVNAFRVCDLHCTPSLATFTMSRALRPASVSPTWKLCTVPEMEPLTKAEECFLHPFVLKRREMTKPVPTKVYSQPRQPQCAKHVMIMLAHLLQSHHFLLVQNLSSRRIAPTNNMRPKLHDEYSRHQLLKG